MADVARITNPMKIINKVVYDQDTLVLTTNENSSQLLPGLKNLGTVSEQSDTLTSALQDMTLLESSESDEVHDDMESWLFSNTRHSSFSPIDTRRNVGIDRNIPHLLFESRFESGNLRKALQVRTDCFFLCCSTLLLYALIWSWYTWDNYRFVSMNMTSFWMLISTRLTITNGSTSKCPTLRQMSPTVLISLTVRKPTVSSTMECNRWCTQPLRHTWVSRVG